MLSSRLVLRRDWKAAYQQANESAAKWKALAEQLQAQLDAIQAEKSKTLSAADAGVALRARENATTYAAAPTSSGYAQATPSGSQVSNAEKTVRVRDYTRKDGTHVGAYDRRPPSH